MLWRKEVKLLDDDFFFQYFRINRQYWYGTKIIGIITVSCSFKDRSDRSVFPVTVEVFTIAVR